MIEHTTGGQMSLAELADGHKCQPSAILRLTAEHSPGGAYPANVAAQPCDCTTAAENTLSAHVCELTQSTCSATVPA
jgi:hypothetical protein